ncbi:MAG: hypothetical protein ABEJ40_10830 [Haloarculaceae archaeon]
MSGNTDSPVRLDESATESSVGDQIASFVRESRWLVIVFGFDFGLAALGFALDAWAGPLRPKNTLVHQIAALLGAASFVLFLSLFVILLVWVGLLVNEARYRRAM